ncbi:MAG: hypothetical protein ACOWWO_04150 [Peptococcaceae bacterium]
MIRDFFKKILKKQILIYSAVGNEDYFRVIDKLVSAGIKYTVKSQVDLNTRGRRREADHLKIYDIYIEEKYFAKASAVINNK